MVNKNQKFRRRAQNILDAMPKQETGEHSKFVERICIIDACNALHNAAGLSIECDPNLKSAERIPDAIGPLILAFKLLQLNFKVKILIRNSYMFNYEVKDLFILKELERLGILQVVFGKDDDLEILERAYSNGGIVFSNDKFLDYILDETTSESIRNTIRYRVVSYEMSRTNFPMNFRKFFTKVKNRHFTGIKLELRPSEEHKQLYDFEADSLCSENNYNLLAELDFIFYYLQQRHCIKRDFEAPKLPFFYYKFDDLPKSYSEFYRHSKKVIKLNEICKKYLNGTSNEYLSIDLQDFLA